MRWTLVNLMIDLAAALLFLGMVATGYILWAVLPPGTQRLYALWGLSRHEWGTVHAWVSLALLGSIFLHVCLHWKWLATVIRQRLPLGSAHPAPPWVSGVATLLLVAGLFGLFAWAASSGVEQLPEPRPHVRPVTPPGEGTAGSGQEAYAILERACLSCHGPARGFGEFRVDRKEDYFKSGGGRQPLVLPGDSAHSPLIAIVSGARPDLARADKHQLPEREVAVLRAWIDSGAPWPADGTPSGH